MPENLSKPNFLILLGDKYGWQPIPEIIPENEIEAILRVLAAKDKELSAGWYRRDDNAIPPEYVLQSKVKHDQNTNCILAASLPRSGGLTHRTRCRWCASYYLFHRQFNEVLRERYGI